LVEFKEDILMATPLSMSRKGTDFIINFMQVPDYLGKILLNLKNDLEGVG